jgi:dTDP-glucose 4,6-dehydratase
MYFKRYLIENYGSNLKGIEDAIECALVEQSPNSFILLKEAKKRGYSGKTPTDTIYQMMVDFEEKSHMNSVMITGGAGFIGSHLVRRINEKFPKCKVHVVDALTYAGNLDNLKGCNYEFHQIDITDRKTLIDKFDGIPLNAIFHLAAESHVDRSIEDPMSFVKTNVIGTVNLLDLGIIKHKRNPKFVFYHVSTDEVFGSLSMYDEPFNEKTSYDPRSPYSASKASSDHFVRAYHHTYNLPILISNCSNNYGPNQYPEKLIPVVIQSIVNNKPIPIYGEGKNIRDWLWVGDHADAIIDIYENGRIGETYCIGGDAEVTNLELVKSICQFYYEIYGKDPSDLITYVKDRKGHDLRYSINHKKITNEFNWKPKKRLEDGLKETIKWYANLFNSKD